MVYIGVLLLFTGKSVAERPCARPWRDSESALAAWRARGEGRYFYKGNHNLSGPGPGYMIVKLGWPLQTALTPVARRALALLAPAQASWLVELWSCY